MLNNPPAPGSSLGGGGGAGSGGLAGLQPALASLGDQLGKTLYIIGQQFRNFYET